MTSPKKVSALGAVTIGPLLPTCGTSGPADCASTINSCQTLTATVELSRQLASPSLFVDILTNTGVTNVTFMFLKITGGTIELRVTSSKGTDQIYPVSDLFLMSNPVAGSEITAVALRGTANVEIVMAGT